MPPEDGETFAENALGKARAAARATGRASIADDSGIAAAALGGAPGVRSARYAGEHASDEQNLAEAAARGSRGQSRWSTSARSPTSTPQTASSSVFEGRCAGTLAAQPRGRAVASATTPRSSRTTGPPGLTMAELSDEQKDAISHRGRAARALLAWLESEAV